MAELLSVQVHVPIIKGEDGNLLEKTPPTKGFTRLKKIENSEIDSGGKQNPFSHLQKRKPVDIDFRALTYSVSEGRKKSKRFKTSRFELLSLKL